MVKSYYERGQVSPAWCWAPPWTHDQILVCLLNTTVCHSLDTLTDRAGLPTVTNYYLCQLQIIDIHISCWFTYTDLQYLNYVQGSGLFLIPWHIS